jgi:hypothetical protein
MVTRLLLPLFGEEYDAGGVRGDGDADIVVILERKKKQTVGRIKEFKTT